MSKREAAEFGKVSRNFVSSGGSIVALSHVNKHKNSEGKSIYSGVSDLVDDADCAFIADVVAEQNLNGERVVEFTNHKCRGDVARKATFSYSRQQGQTYLELIDSVRRVDDEKAEEVKLSAAVSKKLDEDQDAITAICRAINSGVTSKSAIIKIVGDETGISHKTIRRILAEREGAVYSLGHRWQVTVGKHNKSTYRVLAEAKSAQGA